MSVCCATLFSNERVGYACGRARWSDPRGRPCMPNGKGKGEGVLLSDVVSELFILPDLRVTVSVGV